MRISIGTALGVAAALLVVASPATAGGPTTTTSTTTTTFTVPGSSVPGVSTGVVLTAGMSVTVSATGAVCPYSGFCPGPDGYAGWDTTSTAYGGFPSPGGPAWGLVARVGTGPWVQVGSGPTPLSGEGALEFAVNDDLLSDNSGSFTVTVTSTLQSTCWPGWGYGDKNHTHCGPPGRADAPEDGRSDGDAGRGNGDANGNGKANGHKKR
jgi:hypothetical protein